MISYVLVSFNTKSYTLQTIESIKSHCTDYEIILVDNASSDKTVEEVREKHCDVKIIPMAENLGFSRANNIGALQSKGDFLVFINPDTVVLNDLGKELQAIYNSEFKNKNVILSPMILNPDGSKQHCMNLFPIINIGTVFRKLKKIVVNKTRRYIPCEWVTGVCYGMAKQTFEKLNGWNEEYDLYSEDLDMCYRLHKFLKGRTYVIRDVKLIHYGNQSGKQVYRTNYASFRKKTDSLKKFFKLYFGEEKFKKYLRRLYKINRDENIVKYLQEEQN